MGHSYYIANKSARTCFELGKWVTVDFDILCDMVNEGGITYNDFYILGKEYLQIFTDEKVKQLYEYIKSVPREDYGFIYHEDVLMENFFKSLEIRKSVKQVGSLYTNCNEHIFGKYYEQAEKQSTINNTII